MEHVLHKAAENENWSEPNKWREHLKMSQEPIILDELEKYATEHLFDQYTIISIMNFIYLLERKRHILGLGLIYFGYY